MPGALSSQDKLSRTLHTISNCEKPYVKTSSKFPDSTQDVWMF